MKRVATLWFMVAGLLALTIPALAAEYYAVRIMRQLSPAALESLRQGNVVQFLWQEENSEGAAVYSGLFLHREEAEDLRRQLLKTMPEVAVVSLGNTVSPHWLPCYRRIKLSELGYSRPIVAQGFTAFASFSFPWNSSLSPRNGYLRLYVTCSPILNQLSTIKVVMEGIPVTTVLIKSESPELVIDVPLDLLQEVPIGPSLDVELYGHLSITDDRCVDEPSGNLWMLIDNASYVQVQVEGPPGSITDFLNDPGVTFNVVLQNLQPSSVAALCRLSTVLGAMSTGVRSRFTVSDRTAPGLNIFIGDYENDLQLCGNNLYVAPKGVGLLVSKWWPTLIFTTVARADKVRRPTPVRTDITFFDLGLETKIMKGIGDLTFLVPFTTLQLGAWPSQLSCTVVYATTPVQKRERAFLKLKLNGVLIAARELVGEGTIRTHTFRLPARYLQFSNTLEITVSYYLNRGDCQGSLPEMEVSVFKDSFISVQDVRSKPPLSLASYPAVLGGKGALIIDEPSWDRVTIAARLLEILARKARRPLNFDLTDLQTYRNRSYRFGIFVVQPDKLSELRPIVNLVPAFRIVHPLTREVLMSCETKDPVAVVQAYYDDELPMLVFSHRPQSAVSPSSLWKLFSPAGNANVGLMKDGTPYCFEVGEKLRVVYPYRKDLSYYWNRYRLVVFLVLAALALVFLFYVYRKLAKR